MRFLIALFLMLSATALPAKAQDSVSPDQQALASRFIELSLGDNLSKAMNDYIDQMVAADSNLEPDQADWMRANLPAAALDMVEELAAQLVPVYAEVLTEQELRALVEFYDTPMGREIARKMVTLTLESEEMVQGAMERFTTEIFTKFCAEFECPAWGTAGEDAKTGRRG